MKRYILIATAVLAFASCTKDSVKEVNKGLAIDFHTNITRATETVTDNLRNIWVTCLSESETNYFTDIEFTLNGNYFTSETAYYWPANGSDLQFYAYAPEKSKLGTLSINKATQKLTGFSPASDISDQVDFIMAKTTGNKADNAKTGVELVFDHALSQIEVTGISTNSGYVYKVKGIRIGQVISTADFDFTDKKWTLGDSRTDYEVTYETARTLNETDATNLMAAEGDNAMLIPQQLVPWDSENDKDNTNAGAYIAVLVNITTKDGAPVFPKTEEETYDWIATPVNTKWDDGFKYTYRLDLSQGGLTIPGAEPVMGGKIQFTAEPQNWKTDSSTSYNYIDM